MDRNLVDVFPPISDRTAAIEELLAAFQTVTSGRTAVYVSAALTTGRRFSIWRAGLTRRFSDSDPEYRAAYLREVIEPNRREVSDLVTQLRRRHRIVIDPTALPDLPGWSQSDYRVLWGHVIARYVSIVVFGEGWQYSSGSAYEYLVALQTRATTLNHLEAPIRPHDALELLESALEELRRHGTPSEFLEAVVAEIRARH